MPVERGREPLRVRIEVAVEYRLGGERRGHERLVHPVPGERVDEPGSVTDDQDAPSRWNGTGASHRQPVAAKVADHAHLEPMRAGEPRDVVAQTRPFAPPPPDADVRVIAFREHPPVAAGHDSELHDSRTLDPRGVEIDVRHVSFERDPVDDVRAQPCSTSDDPVRAVGADEHVGMHGVPGDPYVDAVAVRLDIRDASSVTKVCPGRGSLLGEVQVQPSPLRHEDERCRVSAREAPAVAKPDPEPVDHVLDDRARQSRAPSGVRVP